MNLILLYALLAWAPGQDPENLLDWLPANTQTVVVVNDVRRAVELRQSPQDQESTRSFQERFAITPDELAKLVAGQFLRAEILEADGASSEVAIAHVAADVDVAVKNIHDRLKRQNAEIRLESFGSQAASVITRKGQDGAERISVHLIHDGRLVLADSLAAANLVVKQSATADGSGLARQNRFAQVWSACSPALAGEFLTIAWYADPWMGSQSQQPGTDPEEQEGGGSYQVAKRHGLNGILGVGGTVAIGERGAQTVNAFAYAPPPLLSSLRIADDLQGTDDLTLPVWVSRTVTDVVVLHGNMGQALEHAGLLFDDGFADGVAGTFDEVLVDLRDLLELDLKKELFPQLGPRLYLLNGEVKNRDWQPLVVAFEVKDAQRVAGVLRRLIADDPEAKEVVLDTELDRVWHAPGRRGGRDFVLGMLKGMAVYANDFEFAKKAMRFDGSEPLLPADQFVAWRDRVIKGSDEPPSILVVRNPNAETQASGVHPLDLVFQDTKFFVGGPAQDAASMQWLPRRMTMLLARHHIIAGFKEKDGWKFVTRTEARTGDLEDER